MNLSAHTIKTSVIEAVTASSFLSVQG